VDDPYVSYLTNCVMYGQPSTPSPSLPASSSLPASPSSTSSSASSNNSALLIMQQMDEAHRRVIASINTKYEQQYLDHLSCEEFGRELHNRMTLLTPSLELPEAPIPAASNGSGPTRGGNDTKSRVVNPTASVAQPLSLHNVSKTITTMTPRALQRVEERDQLCGYTNATAWSSRFTSIAYVAIAMNYYPVMNPEWDRNRNALISHIRTASLIHELNVTLDAIRTSPIPTASGTDATLLLPHLHQHHHRHQYRIRRHRRHHRSVVDMISMIIYAHK
jgi:hypothetical protein